MRQAAEATDIDSEESAGIVSESSACPHSRPTQISGVEVRDVIIPIEQSRRLAVGQHLFRQFLEQHLLTSVQSVKSDKRITHVIGQKVRQSFRLQPFGNHTVQHTRIGQSLGIKLILETGVHVTQNFPQGNKPFKQGRFGIKVTF